MGHNRQRKRLDSLEDYSNTRFLTIEEVKAAQAEATQNSVREGNPNIASVFDGANRPQQPHIHLHHRKRKTFSSRIKKFFSKLRFRAWKKKYSSSSPSEFQYINPEAFKKAKSTQEFSEQGSVSTGVPAFQSPDFQRESHHTHKHKRKRGRKRFWHIFRKRKKKDVPFIFPAKGESLEPEKEKAPLKVYVRSTVNSTAMFMLAYQISWLIYQFTVMIVASFSKIDSVLYYYEVMFPVGNSSPKWNQTNIIFITLSGPLISLIFWALYRFLVFKKFHPSGQMRIFLVWLYLNSMMLFFGAFVGGAITRQGFGYVVEWLYINIAFRILLSLIFLSLIGWLSWSVVRFLPEYSGLDSWKHNRYAFVLSRLVIPWLIGGGIMVLLKITTSIPQHENIFNYDAFNLATLLFAVVPPLFNSKVRPHLIQGRKTYPRVHRFNVIGWVLLAVIFVSIVRIVLAKGLYFQLILALNLGFYH